MERSQTFFISRRGRSGGPRAVFCVEELRGHVRGGGETGADTRTHREELEFARWLRPQNKKVGSWPPRGAQGPSGGYPGERSGGSAGVPQGLRGF